MKKIFFISSTILLIVVGFSISMTSLAWSIDPMEMLYLPLWLLTIVGLILFFATKKLGVYVLIGVSILWLLQMAGTLGWFVTFEPDNIALWGMIGLPTMASVLIATIGTKIIYDEKNRIGIGIRVISILIPIVGILLYANKTYDKSVFSEFYNLDEETYKVVFKPQPSDTRQFELELNSDELRILVKDKATFVADHHYFPNAKFRVNMTFSRINEIELYKVGDYELEEPIKWEIEELNGETEFLK